MGHGGSAAPLRAWREGTAGAGHDPGRAGFIAASYADHRALIAVDQVVQLFCSYLLWRWLIAFLDGSARATRISSVGLSRIRVAGLAVIAASVLTCLAVLVLVLVPSLGDGAVRLFADATDWTDVLSALGSTVLGVVAPLVFLLFVLAVSVWLIRGSRVGTGVLADPQASG